MASRKRKAFRGAQAIASIERITRGNLRLLERLFPQINRSLKINQLDTITDDAIGAAASILVIGSYDTKRSQNTARKRRTPQKGR